MNDYQIITDACADLPPKLVEELGIHVIPMSFNFGDESYTHYPDEREYSAKDFFDRLRGGDMSTTNQINQAAFTEVLKAICKTAWSYCISAFPLPFLAHTTTPYW